MNSEEVHWVHVLQWNVSGGGKLLLLTWLVPKYTQNSNLYTSSPRLIVVLGQYEGEEGVTCSC